MQQKPRSQEASWFELELSLETEERTCQAQPLPRRQEGCCAHSPGELAMGTNAAELRMLWSPFGCPSVADPLKHKQLG